MQKSGSQLGTNQKPKLKGSGYHQGYRTILTKNMVSSIFRKTKNTVLFTVIVSKPTVFEPVQFATYAQSYCCTLCEPYKEIKLELLWNYLPNMTRIHIVNVSNIFVKIIQGYFQITSFRKTIHIIYPFVFLFNFMRCEEKKCLNLRYRIVLPVYIRCLP